MSSRTKRMRAKADAMFDHNPNYTFRQLMESYRFWKRYVKKHKFVITITWESVEDKINEIEEFLKEK